MFATRTEAKKFIARLNVAFSGSNTLNGISSADRYDLRYLSDMDIKRIPLDDINALISYGEHYINNYKEKKLEFNLYKKKRGVLQADFDSVEQERNIFAHIANLVDILKQEYKRRLQKVNIRKEKENEKILSLSGSY